MIDLLSEMGKDHFPQLFLEECKYIVKERKVNRHITRDLETSSDNSDKEDSDFSYKEYSDKEGNYIATCHASY